jgi:hypothetical protein
MFSAMAIQNSAKSTEEKQQNLKKMTIACRSACYFLCFMYSYRGKPVSTEEPMLPKIKGRSSLSRIALENFVSVLKAKYV